MSQRSEKRRGSILAITMIVMLLAATVATGVASYSCFQFRMTARYEIYKNEFEIAEAVLAKTFAEMRFLVQHEGSDFPSAVGTIQPPVIDGYSIRNFTISMPATHPDGSANPGVRTPTEGIWKGLVIDSARYRVTAQVHQTGGTSQRFKHPGVALTQDVELRYIPLHLFGVFYDGNLEMSPGPTMQISGRVHTNSNLYASAGSSLSFENYITVVEKIFHGFHPDSGRTADIGDIKFFDGTGYVSMQPGEGGWLDHADGDWANLAQDRWNGYVNDSAHQVEILGLPIGEMEDGHAIIERASTDPANPDPPDLLREKFEYKAGLKILRNPSTGQVQGFDQSGNPVALSYTDPADPKSSKSVYSTGGFYDFREKKNIVTLDISIANLIEGNIAPANGILYVSNEGSNGAVRIVEAEQLPTNAQNGFSIATDDALYVKGNFNTVDKKAALIAGDAVMLLSPKWDDSKSASADVAVRKADDMTMNAVVFQGIVPTEISEGTPRYSGGVENYFRFLENWTGEEFYFNGSLVCIWQSQKWTGRFEGWPVYRPPNRIWSWDATYSSLTGPPGEPSVYEVKRRHWNIRNIGG